MPQQNTSSPTKLNPLSNGALHESVFSLNVIHRSSSSRQRAKTNCRSIEIPLVLPRPDSASQSCDHFGQALISNPEQEPTLINDKKQPASSNQNKMEQFFPFLSLPFELRLKIYAIVLPTRTHTIVTQYPHNGYYYSGASIISHSTQTLYPAQPYSRPPSSELRQKRTTYKLLNANFHRDFPSPSICPEILRTCKQIRDEAEPVMYGAGAVFDFGVYVDAIVPFLQDRSALARRSIRHVSLGREIPLFYSAVTGEDDGLRASDEESVQLVDVLWDTMSAYLREECGGPRTVDLMLWAENGGLIEETMAAATGSTPDTEDTQNDPDNRTEEDGIDNEKALHAVEDGKIWRQWEWTRALLQAEALRHVKVTWWGFSAGKRGAAAFDGWLGRKMVADKLVRDQMVHEGHIIEGVTVIPGDWYTEQVET